MFHIIEHSLIDSVKVFVFVFAFYIILSFFENKIANLLKKGKKYNSFYGALMGLVPQCGVSVIAGDLYLKRHISIGTLVAIFLACSDEGLVILLTSDKALMAIPLVLIKLIVGFVVGFLLDLFVSKKEVEKHINECSECNIDGVKCCCNHCLEEEEEITKFDIHVWHPFIHSLKLFLVVFIFNVLFNSLFHFIGEDNIISFLEFNKYISPLFAMIIGVIPNCASSIIIGELYISNAISFGALVSGLLINAGLGLMLIFKKKNNVKENLLILLTLVITSLTIGYLTCLIIGF